MPEVTIEVLNNGPLWVEPATAISLVDHDGAPIAVPEGKRGIALCRCGGSVNKPFCDGTHSKIGFKGAEEAVAATESE